MANRKTFESRVEEAQEFIEKDDIKKAISTLGKAIENNPEKDIDKKIRRLQEMLIKKYDAEQFESLFNELEEKIGKDDIDLLSIKLEKIKIEKANAKD